MSNDTHGEDGKKWIGFDLDGTLAEYNGWKGIEHIGKPVKRMCNLAKALRSDGEKVKIVTARVAPRQDGLDSSKARKYIEQWCEQNLGFVPEITHEKDSLMEKLYDDRVVQVIPNTGVPIEDASRKILRGRKSAEAKALVAYLSK